MRKIFRRFGTVVLILSMTFFAAYVMPPMEVEAASDAVPVYRLYCSVNGEHLYTTDAHERDVLYKDHGWGYEGVAWYADTAGTPVYRLYNSGLRNHLYTSDQREVAALLKIDEWSMDNNGQPLYYSNGSVPIYRVYNEALNGMHHLTTDSNEYRILPDHGWVQEGIALFAETVGLPVETQYYPDALPVTSNYSYSLKMLNKYDIYDNSRIILALMTDNPDEDSIEIRCEGNRITAYGGILYDDIRYLDDTMSTTGWQAVKSSTGYVRSIAFEEPGTKTLIINEVIDGKRIEVASLTINVQDKEAAESAWYDSVIASETNSSMSDREKMEALRRYVFRNFKYMANDGTYLVSLTTSVGPWWVVREIDCWDATAIMCEFADRLGLESKWTYAGYKNHYFATVTIDGTEYSYDASPYSSSNIVTEWPYVLE